MRTFLVTLIVFLIFSCRTRKETTINCNKNQIIKIADDLVQKKGFDTTTLNKTVEEKTNIFVIKYYPKDTLSLGGAPEVKVSKKDCKIIEQKFYQ
ncbi:MAG: hypothetical protein QM534_05535 [Sediminibacterium sp.]|nr:hypothetical protein [Sediminibacterium sp.]